MWKRNLLRVLAGLGVLAAVAALLFWQGRDRVTAENYERIQRGMARSQVEAILGPPGDYASGPAVGETGWQRRFDLVNSGNHWMGDSAWIRVWYDEGRGQSEPTVRGSSFQSMKRADVGLAANLAWRIQRGRNRIQHTWESVDPRQKVRE
jgi:hypothetical protein